MTALARSRVRLTATALGQFLLSLCIVALLVAIASAGTDAGPPAATSDIATAPAVVVSDLPDPITEPSKAYAVSKETLAQSGRWALIGVVLTMFLRALSKRIKTNSRLAGLRKWRWPAIFGGLTAIVGAATEVLVAGGTWTAVTLAVVAALITLVDGFGADEDKPAAATA